MERPFQRPLTQGVLQMYWLKPSSLLRSSLLVIGIMLVPIQASWSQEIQTSDLIQRLNWIRFELVQGRIVTRDTRQGQSRSATVTNEKKKIREEVTLKIVGGTPLFQYRYQDADQMIQIELINNHRLVIKRNPTATADWPSVEVQQPERGPLRMVVTQGPSSQVYTAKHLWQLMLSHPDPCRKHLYPLLELLRSDWQLEQWSEQVETSLIRMASYHTHPEYDHLQRLIVQLADPAFRIRQSADRQLRAMGQPVISYLNQLNTKNMTTEQRLRIRRICQSLTTRTGDTPEAVTAWLLSSPRIWFILMNRPENDIRKIAHQQLSRLVQKELTFTPTASLQQRQLQLGRIEGTIFPR